MKRALKLSPKIKKTAFRLVRAGLLVYVLLVLCAMIFENQLIFHPAKFPAGDWNLAAPATADGQSVPQVEDVWLTASDGVKLHGWLCSPVERKNGVLTPLPTKTTILFFHGNGGNITDRYPFACQMMAMSARVFLLDYRGYGKSGGSPSEAGVCKDADAAWQYLTQTRHVPAKNIIVYGESLGGAVAIDLASRVRPGGLIVQSSFTSMPDMAAVVLPFVPRFAVRTKLDSLAKIGRVACPKLFVHSTDDDVVPYRLGRQLFEAAPGPKQVFVVHGAGHNNTVQMGGAAYLRTVRLFLEEYEAAP